jgi:hypothetical protein
MGFIVAILAVGLILFGFLSTAIPFLPSGVPPFLGAFLFWATNGFAEPSLAMMILIVMFAFGASVINLYERDIMERVEEDSTAFKAISGVAGAALLALTGPIMIIAGLARTVASETLYHEEELDARDATMRTAGYMTSKFAQFSFIGSILVIFAAEILL